MAATGGGFKRLLIANRGQVAIRIARAAGELGTAAIAVFSRDDAGSLHVRRADEALALDGEGPAAYLDGAALVAAAVEAGCDAVHPGYGFLSESAGFARACADAGLVLVGPSPAVLDLFGDKAAARRFAAEHGVPTIPGSDGAASVEQAAELLAGLGSGGAIAIKAVAGGGGRGMRIVEDAADVAAAFERAGEEAKRAFGRGDLYVEAYRRSVRHIEVQVLGDRGGAVTHLWERDCSLQRHHQKVVEIAPCRGLAPGLRTRLIAAALKLARAAGLEGLGTVEFLLDAARIGEDDGEFAFIEVNPRLQVEHPVTEAISGRDLVRTQIELAAGATLAELGLGGEPEPPRGIAVELRVSLEPGGGEEITAFEPPTGGGIRIETDCFVGHVPNPAFDPLLVKAIAHASGWEELLPRARRALAELRIDGVATNAPSLARVLDAPDFAADRFDTTWLEDRLGEWGDLSPAPAAGAGTAVLAGVRGTLLSLAVGPGDEVAAGATIAVVEAMKMEHLIAASAAGTVLATPLAPGAAVEPGDTLAQVEPGAVGGAAATAAAEPIDSVRPDLAALLDRRARTADEARPEAIARRHAGGHRSARENVADLVDPGSFREYGALALPSQGTRRSREELLDSPADGLLAGLAAINGERFETAAARAMVLAYDQTVFAGTQGVIGHRKAERLFELAERLRLPLVLFAEGGGGRPGDVRVGPTGFDMTTFIRFGRLSGVAPLVGIASRYCFAGNAALLGCCDVIIATADASIGMGGPAMVEAGGLGRPVPAAIGPVSTGRRNGVVDVVVEDDAAAVAVARRYLSYFQGPLADWDCADQRLLRQAIPPSRVRAYDVRALVETLADTGSVLELRRDFGAGFLTALARVEGRPLGILADDPRHLGGAIDSDAADKAARFLQLCNAHGLPVLSLCDTPGFMVGAEAEAEAEVRHAARLFLATANLTVPLLTIVTRKGYGLGAQAVAGGGFGAPLFTVAWPTAEFGGMSPEGYVALAFRAELEAIADEAERRAEAARRAEEIYARGAPVNLAESFELDDVIDPAESRAWISAALAALPADREEERRTWIDAW